jgi:hypothetical protein
MQDVLLPVCLVRDARVVLEATGHLHLISLVPRLHAEGASASALAGQAVADRDGKRLAAHLEAKLTAETGGVPGCHRREN